ncbi:MAG TPA: site-specific integrase [Chthoniobacterales bacterium]|nr:site-specific integrase [Chthoniobacterales bacterium]
MVEKTKSHNGKQRFKKVGPNLYRDSFGRYYLLVKKSGKQFRRSLKTTDPALAKRRLREFLERAGHLSTDGTNGSIRFEEVAQRWLASKTAELKASSAYRRASVLKQLGPFFNGRLVRAIGAREFEAWKIQRGAKLSARSWNIDVETLKQIFGYAENTLRILIDNPARHLKRKKEPKSGIVVPSKKQFQSVLEELRNGHRATGEAADFVEFLAYSGMRRAEAREVRWRDINSDLGTVLVTGGEFGTKNYEARTIPLFGPLRRLIETMQVRKRPVSEDQRLFDIAEARLQLMRACERLGLPRFGHHTMRHFFCSNAIEAGCDFKVIAEWLGHKDGGVLVAMTYGHLRSEHSAAMAKRIVFDASEDLERLANVVSYE